MKYTGERWVPGAAPPLVETQHVRRYEFAAGFVHGRPVIDVACGCGLGAHVLAENAWSVTGIDNSAEAIGYAERHYGGGRTSFHARPAERLSVTAEYDVAVCFEGLEHFEDPEAALAEMHRALRPGGLLIASTPNAEVFTPAANGRPRNPWHLQQWTREEFVGLLAPWFEPRALMGQADEQDWAPCVEAWESGHYIVVVARGREA